MIDRQKWRRYAAGSVLVGATRSVLSRVLAAIASSPPARGAAAAAETLDAAAETSTLSNWSRTFGRWARRSVLFRSLTTEPDPAVVVVDLRETATVGWLATLLDRIGPAVSRARSRSRAERALEACSSAIREAPVRVVSLVVAAATVGFVAVAGAAGRLSVPVVVTAASLLVAAALGTTVRTPWERLADARTVGLLRTALAPPPLTGEDERQ
jgi:hypothetical protein